MDEAAGFEPGEQASHSESCDTQTAQGKEHTHAFYLAYIASYLASLSAPDYHWNL